MQTLYHFNACHADPDPFGGEHCNAERNGSVACPCLVLSSSLPIGTPFQYDPKTGRLELTIPEPEGNR